MALCWAVWRSGRRPVARKKQTGLHTHLDAGDFVVVINAEKVQLTGKKGNRQALHELFGLKGGEKYVFGSQLRARHPEKLILHAVKGIDSEEPARRSVAHQAQGL